MLFRLGELHYQLVPKLLSPPHVWDGSIAFFHCSWQAWWIGFFPFCRHFVPDVRNFLSNKLQGGGDKKVPSYRRQCYNWKRKKKKVVLLWTLGMCGGVKQLASRVGGVSHSLFSKPNKAQVVWKISQERDWVFYFSTPRVYLSLFLEYIDTHHTLGYQQ